MYKHKINNMGNDILPKIYLNSSQNQLRLKWCWCKYTMAWLNHWGINENDISQNIDSVIWKYLVVKRKLRYYMEVINPNLEYQKHLWVVTSSQKKINIAKIRTNSHELQ